VDSAHSDRVAIGVTQEQINAIKANRFDSDCFSDCERATMMLVEEVGTKCAEVRNRYAMLRNYRHRAS